MRAWAALLALVLSGCAGGTVATTTPSPSVAGPSPSPSPVITVLPSTPASPAAGDLPLTGTGLTCRLPIMVETTGSDPVWFQGGFVTFPAATLAPDPRGRINSTGGGAVLTTTQSPVLNGSPQTGLPAYDAAQNRWLPAGAAQTSADGATYVYSTFGQKTIHVVSVATGAERTFNADVAAPGSIDVVIEDVEGSTVYFAAGFTEGPAKGLWRLDLNSGTVSKVVDVANLFAVRDGFGWAGFQDPNDPNPPKADSGFPLFDTLVRVDLATGQRTTWDYRPGHSLGVMAVDGGKVVLHVFDPTGPASDEIRLLSGPVSGGEENGELISTGSTSFDVPRIDADRVWFGNERGLYLYTSASGLQKVYAMTPRPGVSLFPAGPCS